MTKFYRKNYTFFLTKILFFFLIAYNVNASSIDADNFVTLGNDNAPVQIKIYSSLTCPHCANFHKKVLPKIKKTYIEKGLVKVIFIDFPLDLAALNASKILQCLDSNKQIEYLDTIYEKQDEWANGSTIEEININLKKRYKMNSYDIQVELGINSSKFEYVYDENEGRRVITQTKHLTNTIEDLQEVVHFTNTKKYPNVIGINGDEYEYDANEDNYVKREK